MGDFSRQGHGDIELGAGFEILIENKVEAARGYIARLALLRIGQAFGRYANNHRQREVITSSGSTFRHYTHPPLRPRPPWKRPRPFPSELEQRRNSWETKSGCCRNNVTRSLRRLGTPDEWTTSFVTRAHSLKR